MSLEDGSHVGGGVTFEHRGLAQFTRRLQLILGTLPDSVGRELYKLAQEIMTDAKQEYVPVDQGILRASGFVEEPVVETAQISVRLGFGGAADAYALYQHEMLSLRHTTGGAKYLERPVLAKAHMIPERIGPVVAQVYHDAAGG